MKKTDPVNPIPDTISDLILLVFIQEAMPYKANKRKNTI